MKTQKEKTVYIPIEKVNVTNEQLERLRKVKENLEDTFDELVDVFDIYEDFRELDIMIQKVEEAILWSHRVIAKEAQRETLEKLSKEDKIDCAKEDCDRLEPCEKYKDGINKILHDFFSEIKNISLDNRKKDEDFDIEKITYTIKV